MEVAFIGGRPIWRSKYVDAQSLQSLSLYVDVNQLECCCCRSGLKKNTIQELTLKFRKVATSVSPAPILDHLSFEGYVCMGMLRWI
jgi:hypothetical protein